MTGPHLSPKEQIVLRRFSEGATCSRIAHELGISEVSLRVYSHRMRKALGARSIAHAVLLGCRAGLLDGQPQRHGDHAGYTAHLRRGEEPCEPCRLGERAYRSTQRAGNREVA
ncbi:hypothetical protein SPAR_36706 [Streptomyces sparsogenes DSM 40356]|uniref:HTH luxR-type domain-containing protein n=1 Tax=Streptomyces sparsogenes DSM 40356 TaxID=1331668 RepID=A0A1R1S887_9ACTN|nr:hypothetical protein SPAR_36706 [Streptomyces sparsogenes DSM 40356]